MKNLKFLLILGLSGFWVPAQANQQPSLELVGELVLSSTDERDKKTIKLDVILVEEDDLWKIRSQKSGVDFEQAIQVDEFNLEDGRSKVEGDWGQNSFGEAAPFSGWVRNKNDGELLVLEGLYAGFQVVAKFLVPLEELLDDEDYDGFFNNEHVEDPSVSLGEEVFEL